MITERSEFSYTMGTCSPVCIKSPMVVSIFLPRLPPGWLCAKTSSLNPCNSRYATTSASPIATIAVVLDVGRSPFPPASSLTPTSRTKSLRNANVDLRFPVIAISVQLRRFRAGRSFMISSVSPLFDNAMIVSF